MLAHNGDYNSTVISYMPEILINYSDFSTSTENLTITHSSCCNVCWGNQIANGKTKMAAKFVEFGRWKLGEGFVLPPTTQDEANYTEFGWWSGNLSDASGNMSEWVNTNYEPRVVTSYTASFDDKCEEYAIDFKVELYDGTTLLLTDTVTGNSSTEVIRNVTRQSGVTDVKLTITKWSTANAHCKVAEMTTAVLESYDADTILSMDLTDEREIKKTNSAPTGNISTNSFDFSMINGLDREFDNNNPASRLQNMIKPWCKITAKIGMELSSGSFESIPIFSGYIKNWNVPENSLEVSATAVDILDILTKTQYKKTDIQLNQTFSWWIERVINDAGFSSNQYNIDSTLDGVAYTVPVGYFKTVKTHKACLEELTRGCCAVAYQDRLGVIRVQSLVNLSGTVQVAYTRDNYIDKDNQPAFNNTANYVNVKTSPLVLGSSKNVYTGNASDQFTIGANSSATFTIHFNSSPIITTIGNITIDTIAGLSIVTADSTVYSWGANIRVQNTNSGALQFNLSATGQQYEVVGENEVYAEDEASIVSNGKIELEWGTSHWIQKVGLAQIIADNIVGSFADPQKDVSISIVNGNPTLELGDRFSITDIYTTMQYYITKINLNYSKSGFTGSLEGRK